MPRAWSICSTPGCGTATPRSGRCDDCARAADLARGTATQRGYGTTHRKRFRTEVLRRDPICVLCQIRPSTVADHWPLSRRELEARSLDPNDPQRGRGLCATCHGQETAKHQPGGWSSPT